LDIPENEPKGGVMKAGNVQLDSVMEFAIDGLIEATPGATEDDILFLFSAQFPVLWQCLQHRIERKIATQEIKRRLTRWNKRRNRGWKPPRKGQTRPK
jgi:hypothetical protein